jgi:hypothetical protein
MTATTLLALITSAVLLQIVVAIMLGRRRRVAPDSSTPGAPGPRHAAVASVAVSAPDAHAQRTLRAALLSHEVLPFALALTGLMVVAALIDALLHALGIAWVGRYLGIPGLLLIVFSFGHALRKHGVIKSRQPMRLLRLHERMAWLGSLLVLVHAGIHFHAILPWLAIGAMLINVGSGLTGKFLLARARRRLESARQHMRSEGVPEAEIDERLHRDSLTFDIVRQWRAVHFPITLAFAVLTLAHVVSVLLLWSWQ